MASPTSRLPRNTWARQRKIPYCIRDTTPGRYFRGTLPSFIMTSILECLREERVGWCLVLMFLVTRDWGTVVKCMVACEGALVRIPGGGG
jgi:hypothetical protein